MPMKPLLSIGSIFTKSPEQGAQTSIYLATSPEVDGVSGKYFSDCKPKTTSEESYDPEVSVFVLRMLSLTSVHGRLHVALAAQT